ncbi:MAG: DUF6152 family protein, partial [Gammaproteobacteria bacterium]|nr:DUF6152 family protein [Gammaproteobacteria bacterium]
VWFTNPHIRYQLTIRRDDGTTEDWELQAGNVTGLQRQGWFEDTIQVGDRVTVAGDFGRGGAQKLRIRTIETAAGVRLPRPASGQRTAGRNEVNASAANDYTYASGSNDYPVDITGPWRSTYRWTVTVDDLEPKPTPFTADGRRVFEATEAWHDPALRCVAPGLPRIFGAPYHADVVDAGDHYLIVYIEHNTPRRVWMDGRTAPADTPATPMGFSVGHWEGETLIIETTHLSPLWLDGSGLPMSGEGTRIVERYVPSEDRLTVDRQMTIYDPYYTEPLVRQRYWARDDDIDLTEQAPCDPDSYYRDLAAGGLLEEHFAR